MSSHRFLYCRDCNAVHHVTAFDTAPVFEMDGLEIRETAQDDRRAFIDLHFGHSIGELNSVEESRDEDGLFIDPMEVNYVEVTDGREFFTLRSFRKSIADPMSYEVLPRQLRLWDAVGGAETIKISSPQVPQRRYRGTSMDKGGGSWKARAPKPKMIFGRASKVTIGERDWAVADNAQRACPGLGMTRPLVANRLLSSTYLCAP